MKITSVTVEKATLSSTSTPLEIEKVTNEYGTAKYRLRRKFSLEPALTLSAAEMQNILEFMKELT